jgi:NCAIR mutase (PurE)-related protein
LVERLVWDQEVAGSNPVTPIVSWSRSLPLVPKLFSAVHNAIARTLVLRQQEEPARLGPLAVICAGTSDLPVAEEAAVTAEIMGNKVVRIFDVGVAGLHRLLAQRTVLTQARVIIACAGMEGALPTVVAGLVRAPVIAVPTSIGYGASFGGIAALLGMLNSCAPNVAVVNIDNGFGAACFANSILSAMETGRES